MTRISFRNVGGGNEYFCPINPIFADIGDSTNYDMVSILDGAPVRVAAAFDGRRRTLEWDGFDYQGNNQIRDTFRAMLSELRTYKGTDKELHLQDIDIDLARGYKAILVDDVSTTTKRGAGNIRIVLKVTYHYTEAF